MANHRLTSDEAADMAVAIGRGDKPADIADRFGVAVDTVYYHRRRLLEITGQRPNKRFLKRVESILGAQGDK